MESIDYSYLTKRFNVTCATCNDYRVTGLRSIKEATDSARAHTEYMRELGQNHACGIEQVR